MTEEASSLIPLPRGWPSFVKRALLTAVSLERAVLLQVRAGFEHCLDPYARLLAAYDARGEMIEILQEQNRILNTRMECIPASKRPHYAPQERLAIVLLRGRAQWNQRQTAREFLLTSRTVARWHRCMDQEGEDALVQLREPVNRFDDAVTAVVQHLHRAAPNQGRRRKAGLLLRAGLHIAPSTVRRMAQRKPINSPPAAPTTPPTDTAAAKPDETEPRPDETAAKPGKPKPNKPKPDKPRSETPPQVVKAKRPHHVWHTDISTIPVGLPGSGYWVAWWPFSIILTWLCSWHCVLVLDQYTRALLAFTVVRREPTADDVCATLDGAVLRAGVAPKHIISDKGTQFRSEYRSWCGKHGVKHRYGAVGKHGSIAVIERFILSLKQEFLRRIAIPTRHDSMLTAMLAYQRWYNGYRPHTALDGRTPDEMARGEKPPRLRESFEPRPRYPISEDASGPEARPPPRRPRAKLELVVSYLDGHRELPIVELRDAA